MVNQEMFYSYILYSLKSHTAYFGSTNDLKRRLVEHNKGEVPSTAPYKPWELVWYGAFTSEREARDFEKYLKSGSGKAFSYKRLFSATLVKDGGRAGKGTTKLS